MISTIQILDWISNEFVVKDELEHYELTITRAVMDSLIHRFSSNKWPTTIQPQRRATNKFKETTEEWSATNSIPKSTIDEPDSTITLGAITIRNPAFQVRFNWQLEDDFGEHAFDASSKIC